MRRNRAPFPALPDYGRLRSLTRDFGCFGDGRDELDKINYAIQAAASENFRLTGLGLTYGVGGNVLARNNMWLEDVGEFTQLDPNNASRRTLFNHELVGPVVIKRVKINRNGTPGDDQTHSDAAGLWLAGTPGGAPLEGLWLEDVEVTGDGNGTGMLIDATISARLIRPSIHDMRWYDTVDPGSGGEKINGLALLRSDDISIWDPNIRELVGRWGAGEYAPYETDGIGFADVNSASVYGGVIARVGEGHDSSGSLVSTDIWFYGTLFLDCGYAAWKTASVRNSGAIGCRFIRPGWVGAVVGTNSGHTNANYLKRIHFIDCPVIDAGANHQLLAPPVGFRIAWDGIGVKPEDIRFTRCDAIGHTASCTGEIAGTTLTVTAITTGGEIAVGQNVGGASAGTYIAAFLSGDGQLGTYEVNQAQVLGPSALTMTSNMIYGYQIEAGIEDVTRIEGARILGANTAPYSVAAAAVTQAANKTTAVELNRKQGVITANAANLAAGAVAEFTLLNSFITPSTRVFAYHDRDGTIGAYDIGVGDFGNGNCKIRIINRTAGALAEAIQIWFTVDEDAGVG